MNLQRIKDLAQIVNYQDFSVNHSGYGVVSSDGTFADCLGMDEATFIYAANPSVVLALIGKLEAAERERDELRAGHDTLQRAADNLDAERDVLRAELARRDAAASKPVAWISERNLKILGKAFSVVVKHEPVMVRPIALYTTAPPAVVSDETLRDVIRAWSAAPYPGPYVYEKMRKALGAQPPKPVAEVEELSMQIRRLVHSLKNSNPDSSLLKSVPDYMQRKGYWKATDCLRGEHD